MHEIQEPSRESALLIGLERPGHDRWAVKDSLEELRELAVSAGAEVLEHISQKRDSPAAATFIGTGKVEELAVRCRDTGANLVIFDDDLSPAQGRNLGEVLGPSVKVLDRTELILDIFAQRARTREGKIQVELAQLHYMLPRLAGLWPHLSRQRGGVGSRGPGEQQLEVDRRRVQEKIHRLERALEEVQKNRRVERSGRQRLHWPMVAIIGYTNSGKSTLLNALTGANVLAEDKLFATLDPTTRRLRLPSNQNVLLTDTVGFIRKLPHGLVEAFKATLEEVVRADLLVHVVDVSHSLAEEQIRSVDAVLREIGADGKPTLMVFNKIDQLNGNRDVLTRFLERHPHGVAISASDGEGVPALLAELGSQLRPVREFLELAVPHDRSGVIARLHEVGQVVERNYEGETARFKARIPPHLREEFAPFFVRQLQTA